jgi:hypothetical protein
MHPNTLRSRVRRLETEFDQRLNAAIEVELNRIFSYVGSDPAILEGQQRVRAFLQLIEQGVAFAECLAALDGE